MRDKDFMELALKEARRAYEEGEVPIGAVLVNGNGDLICGEHNRVEQLQDATAHAEMLILRGRRNLSECTLYVTVEPCAMCAGAMILCRVKRLVYGTFNSKFGASESLFNVTDNHWLNWQLKVTAGVLAEESRLLLRNFFRS